MQFRVLVICRILSRWNIVFFMYYYYKLNTIWTNSQTLSDATISRVSNTHRLVSCSETIEYRPSNYFFLSSQLLYNSVQYLTDIPLITSYTTQPLTDPTFWEIRRRPVYQIYFLMATVDNFPSCCFAKNYPDYELYFLIT